MIQNANRKSIKNSKLNKLLGITFIFLLFAPGIYDVQAINPHKIVRRKNVELTIQIIDAYYTDLDNDSSQDDIFAIVRIENKGIIVANLDYYVKMELPSGTVYSYHVRIITNKEILNLKNYFWNHAYESGNYSLTVTVSLKNIQRITTSTTLIFDPPGSSQGGEPSFDVV